MLKVASPSPVALYVTNEVPFDPSNGGQRREYELLSRVKERWSVVLLVVSNRPHLDRAKAEQMVRKGLIAAAYVEAAAPEQAPRAFSRRERSHFLPNLDARVRELADRHLPSLIHFEGYFIACSADLASLQFGTVVVEENIEFQLFDQLVRVGAEDPESVGVCEREVEIWQQADGIGVVCTQDAAVVDQYGVKASTICNSGSHTTGPSDARETRLRAPVRSRLYFVGGSDWFPTADALEFLLDDVWPLIDSVGLGLELLVAGSCRVTTSVPLGVTEIGYVPDLASLAASCDALLAPIRFGGGTKLKVLEALSMGLPVFGARAAFYGLPQGALNACVGTATAQGLADAVHTFYTDTEAAVRLKLAALDASDHLETWDQAAASLLGLWDRVRRA